MSAGRRHSKPGSERIRHQRTGESSRGTRSVLGGSWSRSPFPPRTSFPNPFPTRMHRPRPEDPLSSELSPCQGCPQRRSPNSKDSLIPKEPLKRQGIPFLTPSQPRAPPARSPTPLPRAPPLPNPSIPSIPPFPRVPHSQGSLSAKGPLSADAPIPRIPPFPSRLRMPRKPLFNPFSAKAPLLCALSLATPLNSKDSHFQGCPQCQRSAHSQSPLNAKGSPAAPKAP